MIATVVRRFRELEPGYFRRFLALGWPISAQLILTSSLALVDVLMVSALGAASVAAVGLSGKFFFVIILMVSGVANGAGTLAAQYAGQRDDAGVRRILGIALLAGWMAALPFTLVTWLAPHAVMSWFASDPELVRIGAPFLQVTAPFHMLMATVSVMSAVLRVYGRATLPMFTGVFAVGLNTLLNWLLIFGHGGLPALGVQGAAWATLMAKLAESALLIGVIYYAKSPLRMRMREFVDGLHSDDVGRVLHQCVPLVLNELFWAGGVFAFSIIYGRMGTLQLASTTLMGPIEGISIDLFIGFTTAAAVLIANALGARDFELAKRHAVVLAAVITAATLAFGFLLVAFRSPILSLFGGVEPEVMALARDLFLIVAFTLWVRLYNVVACVSILRSGGEVRFTLYVDMVVIWLIVLPLTAWCGIVLHWPLVYVFAIAVGAECILKAPAYTMGVLRQRWLRSLVNVGKCPEIVN